MKYLLCSKFTVFVRYQNTPTFTVSTDVLTATYIRASTEAQCWLQNKIYRQVSNISGTKSQHLKYSRTVLRLFLLNPWKPENEDVFGTAPTGDAPTISEWSTILLHAKVRLILEVLRYLCRIDFSH